MMSTFTRSITWSVRVESYRPVNFTDEVKSCRPVNFADCKTLFQVMLLVNVDIIHLMVGDGDQLARMQAGRYTLPPTTGLYQDTTTCRMTEGILHGFASPDSPPSDLSS